MADAEPVAHSTPKRPHRGGGFGEKSSPGRNLIIERIGEDDAEMSIDDIIPGPSDDVMMELNLEDVLKGLDDSTIDDEVSGFASDMSWEASGSAGKSPADHMARSAWKSPKSPSSRPKSPLKIAKHTEMSLDDIRCINDQTRPDMPRWQRGESVRVDITDTTKGITYNVVAYKMLSRQSAALADVYMVINIFFPRDGDKSYLEDHPLEMYGDISVRINENAGNPDRTHCELVSFFYTVGDMAAVRKAHKQSGVSMAERGMRLVIETIRMCMPNPKSHVRIHLTDAWTYNWDLPPDLRDDVKKWVESGGIKFNRFVEIHRDSVTRKDISRISSQGLAWLMGHDRADTDQFLEAQIKKKDKNQLDWMVLKKFVEIYRKKNEASGGMIENHGYYGQFGFKMYDPEYSYNKRSLELTDMSAKVINTAAPGFVSFI